MKLRLNTSFSPRQIRAVNIIRMGTAALTQFLSDHPNPCLRTSHLPPLPQPEETTIRAWLHRDCSAHPLPAAERPLLEWLIECVNDDGYLELPPQLPLPPQDIEAGIRRLQTIAAPGIAARSAAERLLLLLAETPPTPARRQAECFVNRHWDALTRKRWDKLPQRGRQAALALLESLPSVALPAAAAAPLLPDILFVHQRGFWQAQAAAGCRISVTAQRTADSSWSERQQAGEIAAAVAARRRLVLVAAQYAADHQSAFFQDGAAALTPLPAANAAAEFGVSATMLSHILNEKHSIFSGGQFPLKYLYGYHIGSRVIQHHLRQMISNENPRRPLSDNALCQQLRSRGFRLARRTIAKHRQQAGIAAAPRRKRASG